MRTYQDLKSASGDKFNEWLIGAINDYKSSEFYETAVIANEYAKQKNVTITKYQKLLYTVSGKAVPDNFSANHKCASNFFNRFVTQEASYLLGNGASFSEKSTKEKLGKDFDKKLYKIGKNALIHGVCYGFFNKDHLHVFTALEFVPFYDERTGALRAGIRFWQIDSEKPLMFTLYEEDGYTGFILENGNISVLEPKRNYIEIVKRSKADGEEVIGGENYSGFPIVPMWANEYHQSEIIGTRQNIDCYDLIKSGFANDLDDASQIYWILENAGGMDDTDLAKFIQRIKTVHAATTGDDDGTKATAHTLEVPYQSREVYLNMLSKDLHRDFMAVDMDNIVSGANTATQIRAAYDPLNMKADEFELSVIDFVNEILKLNGIEDEVTFTRSMIVNKAEDIQTLVSASGVLPEEYIMKKIIETLGDIDKIDDILKMKMKEEIDRYNDKEVETEKEEEEGQEAELNEKSEVNEEQ